MKITFADLEALARTIYGEARGTPFYSKINVGKAIVNRARFDIHGDGKPDWWGETIEGVCKSPKQFTCWNDDDVNRPKLLAVELDDPMLRVCVYAALRAIDPAFPDMTRGSTHYYAKKSPVPWWAEGKTPVLDDGHHLFFNNIEPGKLT